MANQRITKDKRALILSAIVEGTPINAVCRMFAVGNHTVLRVIAETGEALIDYMIREFRDLPVARLEMDEAWQYVGKHGQRMATKEAGKGDFWLWAAIDADTKLVVNYHIGGRKWTDAEDFVQRLFRGVLTVRFDGTKMPLRVKVGGQSMRLPQ